MISEALHILSPVPPKTAPADREAHFVNRTLHLHEVEDHRSEACIYRSDCLDDALRILLLNAIQRKRIKRTLEGAKSFVCASSCPYRNTVANDVLPRFSKSLVA